MILRPPVYCDAPSNICKYIIIIVYCLNGSGTLILSCFTALVHDLLYSTLVYVFANAPPLLCNIGEFRHLGLARGTNMLFVSRLSVHSPREVENSPLSPVGWLGKR